MADASQAAVTVRQLLMPGRKAEFLEDLHELYDELVEEVTDWGNVEGGR